MSKFEWPWKTLQPGVYFNIPAEEYHALPCVNSSGLKEILISETNFWCKSWMNPLKEDDDTEAKKDGRAYHTRILEGKEAFYHLYGEKYEDDGDPDMLRTTDDIKKCLKEHDLPVTFGKKIDGAARLIDAGIDVRIMDIEKVDFEREAIEDGRELLDAKKVRYIELMAKIIEHHPEMKSWLLGGYPEVTVIWDDEELGVRCKARLDYLKTGQVVDLKTFANQLGKTIDKAIEREIANHRYHIPTVFYLRAAKYAKELVKAGHVFGAEDVDPEWLEHFAKSPCEDFWFIFIQKGNAPVVRGAKWSLRDSRLRETGHQVIKEGCEKFLKAYQTYGEDAWLDINRAVDLSFESLPSYITDI